MHQYSIRFYDLYSVALAHGILLHHLYVRPVPCCLTENSFSTRFATAARINDFSARDISQPSSERTRYILSAFINLMRFNQQRAMFVQSVRSKSNALIDKRVHVSRELEEEEEELSAVKAKQLADEPKCEEFRQENISLTTRMVGIKEIQEQTAGECEVLRKDKSDLLKRKARPFALVL
jgi:kinetochore protein Nuf2